MLRKLILILLFMVLALGVMPIAAQSGCNPFTKVAQPGMLAIGTIVDFTNYELSGPVTRTGTVDEYYITTYCPQAAIFNMDAQAYVVKYAAADGSRRIMSLRDLTVR